MCNTPRFRGGGFYSHGAVRNTRELARLSTQLAIDSKPMRDSALQVETKKKGEMSRSLGKNTRAVQTQKANNSPMTEKACPTASFKFNPLLCINWCVVYSILLQTLWLRMLPLPSIQYKHDSDRMRGTLCRDDILASLICHFYLNCYKLIISFFIPMTRI
jgi:hypothetical protein